MSGQLRTFIKLLTGSDNNAVHWQVFHDSDKSEQGKSLARSCYGNIDSSIDFLQSRQQQGCGVYITVNETDTESRKNIIAVRACFIDGDNQPLPTAWACEPDIIVARSDLNWHAYWLLGPNCDLEQWSQTNYRLALYYGVKDRLFDLARVMRAPGFMHLKNPDDPQEYKLIYHRDSLARYTLEALATGHHLLDPGKIQEYRSWWSAPKVGRNYDQQDIITDSDDDVQRAIQHISKITPEVGDLNNTLFRAAAICKDHGLSEETTVKTITDWWVNSWPIPVEPGSIKKVTDNAYRYGTNAIGIETTQGKFANAPPLVEQVGTTEDLRLVVEGIAMSDVKYGKNHTVNARVFVKSHSEVDQYYITVMQETYVFQGTHWRKLEDKELEKHVFNVMLDSRPGMDVVSQTANAIRCLTADFSIKKIPSWIEPGQGSPKNFIAFKNGILDISNNQWQEHTYNLFYTNCLDYDYQPKADSSGWIDYLNNEVFNQDQETIDLLQEWFGYQLVNSYDYQKIAVFIGAPRSGKGTVAGVIRHIVGPHNVAAPSLTGLAKDPTLEVLQDKPVAIIGDAHKVPFALRDIVLEHLKMISGCDPITFGRKWKGSATIKFPTRFTLCTNKMPEFLDTSGALAGRLLLMTFRNSYLDREDPKRLEKLLVEAPGILNWAIQGLNRLRVNGRFTMPADSVEMMASLKEDLSPITAFIADCLTITGNKNDVVQATIVYAAYKRWCAVNEHNHMRSGRFKTDLLSCNYSIRHLRKRLTSEFTPRVFTGIQIANSYENVTPGKFQINS